MCECLWVLQQLTALFVCLFFKPVNVVLAWFVEMNLHFPADFLRGSSVSPEFFSPQPPDLPTWGALLLCQRETLSSSSSASSPFPPELGHRLKTTGFNRCFHTTSYIYCFVVYDYLQSLKNKGKKTSFQYFCEFILVIWHYKETMHLKGLSVYFYMK